MNQDLLLKVLKGSSRRAGKFPVRKFLLAFGVASLVGVVGLVFAVGLLVQAGRQIFDQVTSLSAPPVVSQVTAELGTALHAWIPVECRLELRKVYDKSLWRSEPVGDILGSLVNVCVKNSTIQPSPGELI
ncbi:MAG: hypothetical protein ACK5Y2_05760 [Bdellovibrionales bacterium]